MSAALRSVAFRFVLGPAPIASLGPTREAVLLELVRAARLGRGMPTPRETARVVDRAHVTVRRHVVALRRAGLVEPDGPRPTAAAMEAYPAPKPRAS